MAMRFALAVERGALETTHWAIFGLQSETWALPLCRVGVKPGSVPVMRVPGGEDCVTCLLCIERMTRVPWK